MHPSETDPNKLDVIEKTWLTAWTIGFTNPLVPIRQRIEYENQMIRITAKKPHVIASIMAGAISMMSRLLPVEDPWRQLQRVADDEVLLPGGYYFDATAATDLTMVTESADWRLDRELASLTEELDDAGKVVLSVAPHGWDKTLNTIEKTYPLIDPTLDDAESTWDSLTNTLRWITTRYMSYTDPDSLFVSRCLALAMQFSDAPMNNDTKIIDMIDDVDPDGKIPNGSHTMLMSSEY